jgi:hypothetical protein
MKIVKRILGTIFTKLTDIVCFDLPKPISKEERARSIKKHIRQTVATLSRGNLSLQQGHYILGEDIDRLRKENLKLEF